MAYPQPVSSEDGLTYSCRELDCLVRYSKRRGYFLNTQNRLMIEQYPTPHEHCSSDGYPLYLLEVQPQHPSFRLWRCPICNVSRGGGELT